MRRLERIRLFWRACALIALAGCGHSDPPLFPITQGSAWSYEGDSENVPLTQEAKITSSRQDKGNKDGKGHRTVVMAWSLNGKPAQEETYLVTENEVARSKGGEVGETTLDPPLPILKLPLAPGKRWTWQGTLTEPGARPMPATAVAHVAAKEKIKTKAGEFETYRVGIAMNITYLDAAGSKQTNATTIWFAPGVGIVKQYSDQKTPDGETRQSSRELTKYKIVP